MTSDRLESFLSNPTNILLQWPRGGDPLAVEVRGYAAAGGASLEAVIQLIPAATTTQLSAIGEGLGRAQTRCSKIDPYAARLISNAIQRVSRREVLASYQRVLIDDTPKITALPSTTTTASENDPFAPPKSAGSYYFPRATDRDHLTINDPFQPIK